jgi:hypothetical protein
MTKEIEKLGIKTGVGIGREWIVQNEKEKFPW